MKTTNDRAPFAIDELGEQVSGGFSQNAGPQNDPQIGNGEERKAMVVFWVLESSEIQETPTL